MYGYNAEPPIAIPIYTVLPYCVMYRMQTTCIHDRDGHVHMYTSKNSSNYNVEYRDGIKSEGDKIGMPCSDIRHVIPSPRESTTQALYCRRGTQLREWCTCS